LGSVLTNKFNKICDVELIVDFEDVDLYMYADNYFDFKIAFAIAIREIDAWLITIYSDINETGLIPNPKERFFNRIINEPNRFTEKEKLKIFRYNDDKFEQYSRLTKDFRNERKLEAATVKNLSLKRFCEDLEKFKTD